MSDKKSNQPRKDDRPTFLPTFSFGSRAQSPAASPNEDAHTHSTGWLSNFSFSNLSPSKTPATAAVPVTAAVPGTAAVTAATAAAAVEVTAAAASTDTGEPSEPSPHNLANIVADKWHEFEHLVKHLSPSSLEQDVDIAAEIKKVAAKIEKDMKEHSKDPELAKQSKIRRGLDLCQQEEDFLKARLHNIATTEAFAKFIGVSPSEVREEDIPIIGIGAAGGGYRAMIATAGFLKGAEKTGLLGSTTYLTGVSGATWCLGQYYSVADCNLDKLIKHFQNRLNVHPANTAAVTKLLMTDEYNKFFLEGIVQKHLAQIPITPVDLYGTLLGGRLLFESDDPNATPVDPFNFKLSAQHRFIKDGLHPMPIYTAVRHEMPWKDESKEDIESIAEQLKGQIDTIDWWNWMEFTPYEVGCEELEAFSTTPGFGNHYENGNVTEVHPEQSLSLLLGIFGSVFCASLGEMYDTFKFYLKDGSWTKSLVDGTTSTFKKGLGQLEVHELAATYLVHASDNPNFIYHLPEPVALKVPKAIIEKRHLGMVDAGIDNNIPFNPFISPRRHVDVVIALDNAVPCDPSDLFARAAKYAQKQGTAWPSDAVVTPDVKYPNISPEEMKAEDLQKEQAKKAKEEGKPVPPFQPKRDPPQAHGMDYALVFDGPSIPPLSSSEANQHIEVLPKQNPTPKPLAAIHKTMIYVPLLPNPEFDPTIDPSITEYCSTWNLKYEPEQVQKLADLAEADMLKAIDKIRQACKKQWERKKKLREDREAQTGISGFVGNLFGHVAPEDNVEGEKA